MIKSLLDTNYFIRAITSDHEGMSMEAQSVIQQIAENELEAETVVPVIAEIVYVLNGKLYAMSRKEIVFRLEPIIMIDNLYIENKTAVRKALHLYMNSNLDFVDCYLKEYAKINMMQLLTFDKNLLKSK